MKPDNKQIISEKTTSRESASISKKKGGEGKRKDSKAIKAVVGMIAEKIAS